MSLRIAAAVLLLAGTLMFLGFEATSHGQGAAGGRVLKLEELTYPEIGALDRAKTLVFLTFGNLEEHGPHLPVGSDYFQAVGVRDGAIERLRKAHPDFNFVLFPVIPLGEGAANDFAGQPDFPGTYPTRQSTLRDVAIDIGGALARQGFRYIFIVQSHGTPLHNLALNEAAAFVSERYSARMVHLTGYAFGAGAADHQAAMEKHLGKGWREEVGIDSHGGAGETSANLAVRGELVKPAYRDLPPFTIRSVEEFYGTSKLPGWRGYWGAPSRASRALGEDLLRPRVVHHFRIAGKILADEDLSKLPLFPENFPASEQDTALRAKLLERYAQQSAEVAAWLEKRRPAKP